MRAPADGYTLLMANTAAAINATLYDKLSFNFIRDIAPVAGVMRGGYVVEVHPFAKLVSEETEKWGKVVRAANIKPE